MQLSTLASLNAERAARRAAVLVTDIDTGEQRLVREADSASDPLASDVQHALQRHRSGLIERDGRQYFLVVQTPQVKMIAIGAVHISQALATMCRQADMDVTIVDPRTAFATPERFPDISVQADWPDKILPQIGIDRFTAVVALTHDPKIDDPALSIALRSECFYIGALGSRKTHEQRVRRLAAAGFTEKELARIHAPIGLDIGAISPAEIAVSILAEIIESLNAERRRR